MGLAMRLTPLQRETNAELKHEIVLRRKQRLLRENERLEHEARDRALNTALMAEIELTRKQRRGMLVAGFILLAGLAGTLVTQGA
jgi:ferric-dicitrate binding protein FerR (iron transport regulator)